MTGEPVESEQGRGLCQIPSQELKVQRLYSPDGFCCVGSFGGNGGELLSICGILDQVHYGDLGTGTQFRGLQDGLALFQEGFDQAGGQVEQMLKGMVYDLDEPQYDGDLD